MSFGDSEKPRLGRPPALPHNRRALTACVLTYYPYYSFFKNSGIKKPFLITIATNVVNGQSRMAPSVPRSSQADFPPLHSRYDASGTVVSLRRSVRTSG